VRIIKKIILIIFIFNIAAVFSGCQGNYASKKKNLPYNFPEIEAQWIRDGEPIEFEGGLWYPQDNVDILLDEEVSPVGEYSDVEIFINKVDVRPYEHLYTKFGRNKFRSFREKKRSFREKKND